MMLPTSLWRSRSKRCAKTLRGTRRRNLKNVISLSPVLRAANVYKDLIESVGEESEAPRDAPVVDFHGMVGK
jgi:hypothetical protein